jgi:hypothetical protein
MANQPRKHWTTYLFGICAAVAIAWAVTQYLHFTPWGQSADTEGQRQPTASTIVLPEVGIRSGTSVTTPDGVFTVKVDQIVGAKVGLTVSTRTKDVYRFKKAEVGRRLVVIAPDATYYVDVLRIRGNVVYLAMSRDG